MPNVAGREFPYTPQGMAAADRYRQSQGMRHGGPMGFRPLGYQDGSLVEPRGKSISDAIDKVSSLVQEFVAQGVPDPVKEAVNSAIATFGIPVDVVNAALKFLGIPVSDTPIGGAKNLVETFGFTEDPIGRETQRISNRDLRGALENREKELYSQEIDPRLAPPYEGDLPPPRRARPPAFRDSPVLPGLRSPDDIEELLEPDDMELLLPKPPWMSHPDFKGYYDPDQLNPFFNPNKIEIADGGYVGRGMRHGGSMGFRPVGYQDGDLVEPRRNLDRLQGAGVADAAGLAGLPEDIGNPGRLSGAGVAGAAGAGVASDVMAIFQGLVDVTRSGSTDDVRRYIEANRQDLIDIVRQSMLPPGQAKFLLNTLKSMSPEAGAGFVQEALKPPQVPQPLPPQMQPLPPPSVIPDFPGVVPDSLGGYDYYPPGAVPSPTGPARKARGGIMSIRRR
jgi:hypothetical protein